MNPISIEDIIKAKEMMDEQTCPIQNRMIYLDDKVMSVADACSLYDLFPDLTPIPTSGKVTRV